MSHQATVVVAVVLTAAAITVNALVMGPAVILLNIGLVASLLAWPAVQSGEYAPGLATALINLPLGIALVYLLANPKRPNSAKTPRRAIR